MKQDNELSIIPNDKYQKFFDKFKEIDSLEVNKWGKAHLLGFFCKKYKEAYGLDYAWKFNHQSPNKCFEVWQLNTLCAKLSANPVILKEYITWAFQTLVPKAKRRLTSISFLTKDDVVNPYKMNILSGNKQVANLDRSTPLPSDYQKVFNDADMNIKTYGELAFLSNMEQTSQISDAFLELQLLGFDKETLQRII
jgi:hypothetical protein